jgi:Uma2 family endonuclease
MAVNTLVPTLPPVIPPVPVRRFTVDEYHQMIQSGILGEDDNVELLEGWIVPEMPRNPVHDALIAWIHNRTLTPRLRAGWFCRGQSAITTPDSEPEPDLALIRGSERDYVNRHPGPADTALAVEIADSSLSRDRSIKTRIYAAAGVPVYWIINLIDGQIEVYTLPTGPDPVPDYRRRQDYKRSDMVPLVVDGIELGPIPGSDLLP